MPRRNRRYKDEPTMQWWVRHERWKAARRRRSGAFKTTPKAINGEAIA